MVGFWLTVLFSVLLTDFAFATVPFYRTLLYGEKLKGFLTISPADDHGDMYVLSFDIRQKPPGNLRWGVHMSSAPYDMAVMTDNCKRVKKSPPIVKNVTLADSTIAGAGLAGNAVVISGDNSEVLACATVILPGQELKHASFHAEPIEGHVHIIPVKNNTIRLLPDLKYMRKYDDIEPSKVIMTWAFVESCEKPIEQFSDGSEIGVDSRATFVYDLPANYSLQSLMLLRAGQPFACASIQNVEPRTIKALGVTLTQAHYFESVRTITNPAPSELHVRDDCLDISTEVIHESYEAYYPSINIFGSETIMLKSLVAKGTCSVLRPQFARPAAFANFVHPIIGRIAIVDTSDKVLLTGELRNVFDEMATRATVQVSDKFAETTVCSHASCDDCFLVQDAAVVVGKNEPDVSLMGVFPWFDITLMRSVIVDLQWMKICANLTQLPQGAISMHALIKRISPVSAPTVASIVALEYPANNYTEVLINKRQKFSHTAAHFRPLDRSVTNGPPCGEQNLGPTKNVNWINSIRTKLGGKKKMILGCVIVNENLVTGPKSIMGTSILLSEGNEVFCGHFEPLSERSVAFATFTEPYAGYIKLTQFTSTNYENLLPTEVYYSIQQANTNQRTMHSEPVEWEVVSQQNMTCRTALVFNPFQVNDTDCIPGKNELCPIGSTSKKSGNLISNSKNHVVTPNLPLNGPYSVVGKSIRLKSTRNPALISCEPLKKVTEASFRWIVSSNMSLSAIQAAVAKKANIELYKIEVDYTRELFQARCSIYRITILEEDEKLAMILELFDMEARKFKDDEDFSCGGDSRKSPGLHRLKDQKLRVLMMMSCSSWPSAKMDPGGALAWALLLFVCLDSASAEICSEPDSCPEGWNTTNFGSCIQYVWEEDQDWISAQKICNERKGNLLMIETEEEFSLFRKWFENVKQEIWIGYTDAKVEDNFTGVDETANSLQPFAANKKMMMPNNDQSDCVTVKYTEPTPFAVEPCNLKLPFICEMKRDWTTTIYPPNEETIEEGYNSICWKQREGARVHAAESALPPPRDSEVLPISHRSEIVQHLPSTNVVAPAPAPVPVPPKLPETINLPPKPLSEFRTIENHLTSPRRVTTRPTSENRISEEVDLPSDDSNEKTAPETVQKTLDEELPRGDADYQKLVSRPHPAPRSLPPLPIRESTFHSLNTRDESFLKTRRTQELFERPRMDVLDNVSAISLDEFWSNAKS
ncbi:unnamed protein product [Caenorhabditis auriculariae]|uniref:C-type lectin domain-containing protein n=1 Tax=Caenorhabditis auriculariae TaxID=2777116 RepID=A0A8S1GQG3_9PELO|nr:unnamed protein product [Caenorhabditis auriculariae]